MLKRKPKICLGKISFIMLAVFAVLLAADLITKSCEEAYGWNFTVIPKLIRVESGVRNPGAAFSFLAEASWGQPFLIILTFVMLAVMAVGFALLPERFVVLKLFLAAVAAGAVGNLVDRISFFEVRDFVWVNIFGNWACCNFADFWIVLGVIAAAIDFLFINEWAAFPLTKKARAAQAEREAAGKKNAVGGEAEDASAEEKIGEQAEDNRNGSSDKEEE